MHGSYNTSVIMYYRISVVIFIILNCSRDVALGCTPVPGTEVPGDNGIYGFKPTNEDVKHDPEKRFVSHWTKISLSK